MDEETAAQGDYGIWTAVALPSRLRVTSYLSQERSEEAAQAFIRQFKARTDGQAPFFTSDKLPAYVAALIRNYQQIPRSSRRYPLPVERINRSLLMRPEHLVCALI